MIWTVPNILTIGRVLAAPLLALIFVAFERPLADWLALAVFVLAAITDFLDGWLARKLGQVSELGKMLDPIADKVMVMTGLLIILAHAHPHAMLAGYTVPMLVLPASLIVLREVLISGVREFLGEIKLPVTWIAKWKTAAQLVAVGCGLLMGAFEPDTRRLLFELSQPGQSEPEFLTPQNAFFFKMYIWTGVATVALLWIAAILTLLSGLGYLRQAIAHMRAPEVF